ncbi:MAG: AbrB/MazE/SpoVT family DNA-binding domain-containing protein [Terriglobales bacterium]
MANKEYAAVNAKGQIVIPSGIRERFDIKQGTKIAFVEEQGRLFIQPVTDAFIESVRGSLKKRGMPPELERDRDREFS